MLKVRAHTCYLGRSGYAMHARSFFRELSKHVELRVRNYTWDDNPDDYLNDIDLSIIDLITLNSPQGERNFPITESFPQYNWKNVGKPFEQDIDIILVDANNIYFYDEYNSKVKIAFTVWESTEIEKDFFEQLLKFDYLWVVTEWHRQMAIKQGYPADRVFVVNEGVNEDCFYNTEIKDINKLPEIASGSFNYFFAGRWDYRKSVPEIIKSFLEAFPNNEDVNLILNADNLYSVDGMKSTEERLAYYGYNDARIKVKHFMSREDYVAYLRGSNVLVTCARSEGWNIPLIEGLAAGTPVTYSDWGAQLEFAKGLGTPIKIDKELPASIGANLGFSQDIPGVYAEPDFNDLTIKLRDCYDNWNDKKKKALEDAKYICEKYNWSNIGLQGLNVLEKIYDKHKNDKRSVKSAENFIYTFNFIEGPFVEIRGADKSTEFLVEFIDKTHNEKVYTTSLHANMWSRAGRKYYTDWLIRITNLSTNEIIEHDFDLTNKRVLISLDSKALGDSLAWFPAIDEFRKKHNCEIIASTFKNELFKDQYPEITFVKPGTLVHNIYASYNLGLFYDKDMYDATKHPSNFRDKPMQQTATDILGLEYNPVKPKLKTDLGERPIKEPYVCLGIHATAQAKYWNNLTGWQEITNYFKSKGMKVIVLSREGDGYMGNRYPAGIEEVRGGHSIDNVMRYLKYSEMFIGVGSGLSWLSWGMNIPTVLISGFSYPYTEILDDNIIRIFKDDVCTGCFNRCKLDAGDWNWCPDHKNTPRQFECSKSITGQYVIKRIENYLKYGKDISTDKINDIIEDANELGMTQNYFEIYNTTKFLDAFKIKNFMEIGTDRGGTFTVWSKLANKEGIHISLDLPHGQFDRNDYDVEKRDTYLKSLGSNVTIIHGNSHLTETKEKIKEVLNGELLDFLFIDGDHTYEGIKQDFEMYNEFVKSGGWIGFHDIKDTEFHRNANCRVDKFWKELNFNKIEFIDSSTDFGGIGFIQKV